MKIYLHIIREVLYKNKQIWEPKTRFSSWKLGRPTKVHDDVDTKKRQYTKCPFLSKNHLHLVKKWRMHEWLLILREFSDFSFFLHCFLLNFKLPGRLVDAVMEMCAETTLGFLSLAKSWIRVWNSQKKVSLQGNISFCEVHGKVHWRFSDYY